MDSRLSRLPLLRARLQALRPLRGAFGGLDPRSQDRKSASKESKDGSREIRSPGVPLAGTVALEVRLSMPSPSLQSDPFFGLPDSLWIGVSGPGRRRRRGAAAGPGRDAPIQKDSDEPKRNHCNVSGSAPQSLLISRPFLQRTTTRSREANKLSFPLSRVPEEPSQTSAQDLRAFSSTSTAFQYSSNRTFSLGVWSRALSPAP